MRDALDRVGQRVGEVVHRVDAPRVAGAVVRRACRMRYMHRIAHVDVGRGHVDLRPQRARAVRELAGPHPREQIEVLRRPSGRGTGCSCPGSVSVPRCSRISSARQVVDVGLALLDQLHGAVVELLEVVRGVVQLASVPVEAEPADVLLDRLDVLDVLLRRDWCRRSAGCTARRTRARCRSSGRSTWRGRCAGSRWARAESACARGRRVCRSSGRRRRWSG